MRQRGSKHAHDGHADANESANRASAAENSNATQESDEPLLAGGAVPAPQALTFGHRLTSNASDHASASNRPARGGAMLKKNLNERFLKI